ncbi:hypothetical protein BX285_4697 [Streptomyces sp. 1114.5]|uniref:hypothetical protein n=1 Tax=unclassified Streptomyces TaxID=2593676 RepID=UPI000BD4E378|nr:MULTISPECIES: hypothetical protein [unclassified Streptomyces]RKT20213.1 hypothetical protein BX285_4697 [Streptomyces sp. 1114.5]SOB78666.1 hypothetical protein SAMN06272789_0026 [Streptomyces sp. 1331.2]
MVARIGTTARGLGIGMAAVVLGGVLSACGSSPISGDLAAGAQKWPDFRTVLSDKVALKQTLPGRAAMPGWEVHRNRVATAEESGDECPGCKLDGTADFEAGVVTATFKITTFGSSGEASAYLAKAAKEFETKAGTSSKLSVPATGNETVAYSGTYHDSPRNVVLMRVGTAFAGVMLEDSSDVAQLQKMATMLARRVEQAAAGQTVDAALGAG